jgi:uncharacterized protein YegL
LALRKGSMGAIMTTDGVDLGERMAAKPLHFIWLLDRSGSMDEDGKIQILNHAMHESIPILQEADQDPKVDVFVQAITFSSTAQWHVAQPTPVRSFQWVDISAQGLTAMGEALSKVADRLEEIHLHVRRMYRPVLALVSDGAPTDDFDKGLAKLMSTAIGAKAIRLALAVGDKANRDVLAQFVGNSELGVLEASHPDDIENYIRLMTYTGTRSSVPFAAAEEASQQTTVIMDGAARADWEE